MWRDIPEKRGVLNWIKIRLNKKREVRDSLKEHHLRSGQFWPGPDRLYAHVNPCRGLCENLVCTSVASLTATVIQRYFHRLFFFSSTQISTDKKNKRWIVKTPSASTEYFYIGTSWKVKLSSKISPISIKVWGLKWWGYHRHHAQPCEDL